MAITYAGVPLTIACAESADTIAYFIPLETFVPWMSRSWPGPGLSPIAWPTGYLAPRRVVPGTLHWPVSASRWAYGFFLASGEQLNQIRLATYGQEGTGNEPAQLVIESPPSGPNGKPDKNATNYDTWRVQMYMLPPLPLNRVPVDGNNDLYLIALVDFRWYWYNYSVGEVGIPDLGGDWSGLFTKIGGIIGQSITVDNIDPTYRLANRVLNMDFEVVPPFLDALAYNCGFCIIVDPNNQKVRAISALNSIQNRNVADKATGNTIRAGDYRFLTPNDYHSTTQVDMSPVLPKEVLVRFLTKLCAKVAHPVRPPRNYHEVISIGLSGANLSQFTGAPGAKIIRDRCLAVYDGTGTTPTNQAALHALAIQIAKDFYRWRSVAFDRVFNGVVLPNPYDGLIDTLEIRYTAEDVTTRITSAPWNGEAEELQHIDTDCEPTKPIVYVPQVSRDGNYVKIPRAYATIQDDQIYLQTSSFDEVFICCGSESSTSSTSHSSSCGCGCPPGQEVTNAWDATVSGFDQGGFFPCPCLQANGSYTMHADGPLNEVACTWVDSRHFPDGTAHYMHLLVRKTLPNVTLTIIGDPASGCGTYFYELPLQAFNCCGSNTMHLAGSMNGNCNAAPDTITITPSGPCFCGPTGFN